MRSGRLLVTRPGALTAAWNAGQRKAFVPPLQLFLLTNALFFAFQSLTGVKVLATTLDMHVHVQPWSALAQRLLDHRLAALHQPLAAFAPLFDQAVALHAKALVGLMVVPFALLPALLFRRSGHSFVGHVVFSLYAYAFLLLLFCAASAAIAISALAGGPGRGSEGLDHVVTIVALLLFAAYLHLAIGRVHATTGLARIAGSVALTAFVAALVLGYRFAIFLITLYSA
jgi:hypothetical protein